MYIHLIRIYFFLYMKYDYILTLTNNMYIEINTSRLFTRFIYATYYQLNQNNSKSVVMTIYRDIYIYIYIMKYMSV